MAVSRWERGTKEPTAECYIRLGKLAGDSERWQFWSRAGLSRADIPPTHPVDRGMPGNGSLPEFEIALAGSGKKKISKHSTKMKLFAIPVLPVNAATPGENGDHRADFGDVAPEWVIAAPAAWCPNPDLTSCLRVKGSSMTPSIHDGDIVAVDGSQTDPGKLSGKIVVAWHRKRGLSLAGFQQLDGIEVLESENRDYRPVVLGKDRSWRIVGKVLWLIRQIS
jgi:hypothetical protein